MAPNRWIVLTGLVASLAVAAPAHGALRWSRPQTLARPATGASVGIDARGDALAIWGTVDNKISYSWRPPRGSWGKPRSLVTLRSTSLGNFVITPRGEATVAWVEGNGTRIVVARARPGQAFADRETIDVPAPHRAGYATVATDDAGEVAVAWTDAIPGPDSNTAQTNVAVRPAGGQFGPTQILGGETTGMPPSIAMNQAGAAMVTWQLATNSVPMASYRPPAGSFGPAEQIPLPLPVERTLPAVAANGDAVALASSFRLTGPGGATAFAVRPSLGPWDGPVSIDANGQAGQVLAEPSGAVSFLVGHPAPGNPDPSALTSFITTRLADGTLVGPTQISSGPAACPHAAMNLGGDMLVTWCSHPEEFGRGTTIAAADRPAGGVLGQDQTLSPPDSMGGNAALNDAGQAIVGWTHAYNPGGGDFANGEVQVATREDDSQPPLPFPPAVEVGSPADPALSAGGTLKIPVRCSARCRVRADGLLLRRGGGVSRSNPGRSRRLAAHRRGRVTLRFGQAAAHARGTALVSVTARGRSPRPVTYSRRIRLR